MREAGQCEGRRGTPDGGMDEWAGEVAGLLPRRKGEVEVSKVRLMLDPVVALTIDTIYLRNRIGNRSRERIAS